MLKPRLLLPSGLAQHAKTRTIVLTVVEMSAAAVVMAIVATAMKIASITEVATRRRGRGRGTVIMG